MEYGEVTYLLWSLALDSLRCYDNIIVEGLICWVWGNKVECWALTELFINLGPCHVLKFHFLLQNMLNALV